MLWLSGQFHETAFYEAGVQRLHRIIDSRLCLWYTLIMVTELIRVCMLK